MDDDNYATSETPAQALTQLGSVVVNKRSKKPTTTRSFQISCPPPKTLSLELVTKDYTATTSTSTSHEPPSIEEVCARIRAFEYDLHETVY
ncbi:MAG: hypothetical protein OEX10_02175 [Candidatus Bathyarchaeota archaeon]|jgi:hypothetical protein|nr:hypothetical protein [Candidatus Bathyarchaeota archaeon]